MRELQVKFWLEVSDVSSGQCCEGLDVQKEEPVGYWHLKWFHEGSRL